MTSGVDHPSGGSGAAHPFAGEATRTDEELRALLETAPDAMVLVDQEGRIVLVNRQTERLFGYSRQELIGRPVEILIPQQYRKLHVQHRAGYLQDPKTRPMGAGLELRGRRKDGSEFPLDLSLGPMATPQGTWTTAAIRDISERQRKERQLHESHERLQELTRRLELETSRLKEAQAVAHIGSGELDLASERITWSDEIYRIFEIDRGELDTYDALMARIHPDDREATGNAYRESVANRTPYSIVHRIVTPDGRIKHVRTRGRTFYDAGGRPLRSVGTIQDVTEATLRKLALQESEARYRRLFETAQDGILLLDEQTGTVFDVNPFLTGLLGYTADEIKGKTLWDLSAFNHVEGAKLAFRQLQATGYVRHEERIQAKDGRVIDVECISNRYVVGDETVIQCNIRDISDRKEAEHALERLNRVRMVLSEINTLIVRSRSRDDLFRDVCRIAVTAGGFRLAWIGLVEDGRVRPVASHGTDDGYIQQLNISIDGDSPYGQGPTGCAIREKKRIAINDIEHDPAMAPWRDAALQRGYGASLASPLMVGGEVLGVLSLYAPEAGFFDEGELKLLDVLVDDIAYAMEFLWNREQVEYLAYYDPLTRLANRRLFGERVEQFVKIARSDDSMVAVLVLDLAQFKSVNDAVGTQAADTILQEFGRRVADLAGGEDHVARIGGDVFAAVVPQLKDASDLSVLLQENVRGHLNLPYRIDHRDLRLSAKIGIAVFPADGGDAALLIRHAESALKHAKEVGEPYMLYASEMSDALRQRLTLESELRRAVEQHEFVLHYQPKVSLETGAIVSVEALLRWRHPDRGLTLPNQFVPLLEKSGLIVEVGLWVLNRATADHREWRKQGLPAPRIAVNVSAVQLRQPDFIAQIASLVENTGAGIPTDLEIEITESMLMSDMSANFEKLTALAGLGVLSTVDDFGTGHSSLAYLARLPVSALKIDQSFVASMADNVDIRNIVATIISLAHSLGLRVIAEGVDNTRQVEILKSLQCDEVQGFLFSQAIPAKRLAALLAADKRYAVA